MAFDVKDHFLVPKHELIPKEIAVKLFSDLGAGFGKMPKIQKGDPAIKEFKPKRGDVIKIERYSPTAGKTTYYRVVE